MNNNKTHRNGTMRDGSKRLGSDEEKTRIYGLESDCRVAMESKERGKLDTGEN